MPVDPPPIMSNKATAAPRVAARRDGPRLRTTPTPKRAETSMATPPGCPRICSQENLGAVKTGYLRACPQVKRASGQPRAPSPHILKNEVNCGETPAAAA